MQVPGLQADSPISSHGTPAAAALGPLGAHGSPTAVADGGGFTATGWGGAAAPGAAARVLDLQADEDEAPPGADGRGGGPGDAVGGGHVAGGFDHYGYGQILSGTPIGQPLSPAAEFPPVGAAEQAAAAQPPPAAAPAVPASDILVGESAEALGVAGALAEGTLAKLNRKTKEWADRYCLLSCKGREEVTGHDAEVDFAYLFEVYEDRDALAAHARPLESHHVTGATVAFVQGTVFTVRATGALNKKTAALFLSANTPEETRAWLQGFEMVPEASVAWVGKDGTSLQ